MTVTLERVVGVGVQDDLDLVMDTRTLDRFILMSLSTFSDVRGLNCLDTVWFCLLRAQTRSETEQPATDAERTTAVFVPPAGPLKRQTH